jgi:hypothetical protein
MECSYWNSVWGASSPRCWYWANLTKTDSKVLLVRSNLIIPRCSLTRNDSLVNNCESGMISFSGEPGRGFVTDPATLRI